MSYTRKLFTGGVILLLLLTLAPIAAAQPSNAPALQATETPAATPAATETVAPTPLATAAGGTEATPSTLPVTGGSANDGTPNTIVPFVLMLIGILIVGASAAVLVARRSERSE